MNWLKIEIGTPDKPAIYEIADDLNIDPDAVFGKVFRVWAWFDANTEDGNAPSVTKVIIDRYTSVTGFAKAMIKAGWLTEKDGFLTVPDFNKHNGESAKKRAQTARRVAKSRQCNAKTVTTVTHAPLARIEKNRIEKKEQSRFSEFWEVYPNKKDKKKASEKWKAKQLDEKADTLIADVENRLAQDKTWRDGFIPMPTTYINGERWNDEITIDRQQHLSLTDRQDDIY